MVVGSRKVPQNESLPRVGRLEYPCGDDLGTEDGTGIHRSRKGLEIQEGHPVLLMDSHSKG